MRLTGPLLVAFGKLVADEVLLLPAPFRRGDQQHVTRTRHAGGAPANVAARTVAAGGRARIAGWAGADLTGDALVADLERAGVECAVLRRGATPAATVVVEPDGERTLLVDPGTTGALTPADVDPAWLDGAAAVHLDGYDLLPGRFAEAVVRTAALARAAGLPVSLDAAAAGRIRAHGIPAYRALIAAVAPDLLFCNADEGALLDPADLAPLVVVHRGGDPTVVHGDGDPRSYPVPPTTVVDATGAGDAFAAGFLHARMRQQDERAAVEAAHRWAAAAVAVVGPQPPR